MQKNIVIVNQALGYLSIDQANYLLHHYDNVAVITGSIREQQAKISEDVKVSWTIKYNRNSYLTKLLTWSIGTIQIFGLLLFKFRNYEVFYTTVPPFAYLLSNFLKNKFYLLVWDVYPDVLKTFGISEQNVIYKIWEKLNKKTFSKAEKVFTISEGMARLLSKYIKYDQLKIIHNWTDTQQFQPIEKVENAFIKAHNLEGQFIVLYSGNIGYTHNVEDLVEVARLLQNEKDIRFLIVGRGRGKQKAEDMKNQMELHNVQTMPFQPDHLLPHMLASSDLGVVMLEEKAGMVSLPSKMYNLMAVGAPILGIAPMESDVNKLIQKYEMGECFEQNEVKKIADFVQKVKADKAFHQRLGKNARHASKDFTTANVKEFLNYMS
jgi:glycosyltransferase involved in cell wall biosynthesis